MPKVGYGSDSKTRYHLPNGLKKFLVRNNRDLEILLMNNRTYCAEIAHNVSAKVNSYIIEQLKAQLVRRAQQLRVKVTNGKAKVRTE